MYGLTRTHTHTHTHTHCMFSQNQRDRQQSRPPSHLVGHLCCDDMMLDYCRPLSLSQSVPRSLYLSQSVSRSLYLSQSVSRSLYLSRVSNDSLSTVCLSGCDPALTPLSTEPQLTSFERPHRSFLLTFSQ